MGNSRSYKVTVIAPTCFYYQVPIFQALSAGAKIDLTVYFCSDEGVSGKDVKTAYGVDETWTGEEELLKGYRFKFLRNFSPGGSYLNSFVGLANFGVWNEIRRERPDAVVVTSWMNPTWWLTYLACLKFKVPIFFMTDANFYAEDSQSPLKKWFKQRFLGDLIFPIASGFLYAGTANRQLYDYYGVPDEKLFPFAYSWGYDAIVEESKKLLSQRAALRKQYDLPEDAIVILYCGRLSSEKGTMDLIEAYQSVSHPRKALVIVGDGILRNRMQQFAESHNIDSIHFLGFKRRDEIGQFYALADFLVLPSHKETWGIVINEALCFGLPVIVSDQVGAGVDLVVPEQNGHIFPAGDVAALTDRMNKLMELPVENRKKMGEKSREMILKWSDRDLAKLIGDYLDTIYQART